MTHIKTTTSATDQALNALESSEDLLRFLEPERTEGQEVGFESFTNTLARLRTLEAQLLMDYARHVCSSEHGDKLLDIMDGVLEEISKVSYVALSSLASSDKEREVFTNKFRKWFSFEPTIQAEEADEDNVDLAQAVANLKDSLEKIEQMKSR